MLRSSTLVHSPVKSDWVHAHGPFTDQSKIELISILVSDVFHVPIYVLFLTQRGKAKHAFARQVAMYLLHICLGKTFSEIGRIFGRDRTTVSHACQLIEDRREDFNMDWTLSLMEQSVCALLTQMKER